MGFKNYKGNSGKNLWENKSLAAGMNYTNDPLKDGMVKALVNLDISSNGNTGKTRKPFYNVLFRENETEAPFTFNNDTFLFRSTQDNSKEYFITFKSDKKSYAQYNKTYTQDDTFTLDVIDGDTIHITDEDEVKTKYRLAGIDTPESKVVYEDLYEDSTSVWHNYSTNIEGILNLAEIDGDLSDYEDYYVLDTSQTIRLIRNPADYSKHILQSKIDQAMSFSNYNIKIKYDKSYDKYDAYGRELVFLELEYWEDDLAKFRDFVNMSMIEEGAAFPYGYKDNLLVYRVLTEYGDQYDIEEAFSNISSGFFLSGDVIAHFSSFPSITVSPQGDELRIMSKPLETDLSPYQHTDLSTKVPTVLLTNEDFRVKWYKVRSDLELSDEVKLKVSINRSIDTNTLDTHVFKNESIPIKRVDFIDGFAFLGTINSDGEDIYSGLVSIEYYVPLTDDELDVDWDKAEFLVKTYKNNVFEIDYEDIGSYSPNLLDSTPAILETQNFSNTTDTDYSIRRLAIINSDNEVLEEIGAKTNNYKIEPITILPLIENLSYTDYDGYVVKWKVIDPLNDDNSLTETPWMFIYDKNGKALADYEVDESGLIIEDGTFKGCAFRGNPVNVGDSVIYSHSFGSNQRDASKGLKVDLRQLYLDDSFVKNYAVSGLYVTCSISVAKLKTTNKLSTAYSITYNEDGARINSLAQPLWDVDEETAVASRAVTVSTGYKKFGTNEKVLTLTASQLNLHNCKKITYWNNRVVLYGSENQSNVLYLSELDNIKYFPAKYALDQFNNDVIYVHPHADSLIVFTTHDVWVVLENIAFDNNGDPVYFYTAHVALSNISLGTEDIYTVKSVGKNIIFMSNNKMLLMKPNKFVSSKTDYFVTEMSQPVSDLLSNPSPFYIQRAQYYGTGGNIYLDTWKPEIYRYLDVINGDVWLYQTIYNPQIDDIYTMILIFDSSLGNWRVYDTKVFGLPYQSELFNKAEGNHTLVRNHPSIEGGVCLMLNEALNLEDFKEDYGRKMDIKSWKVVDDSIVFNDTISTAEEDLREIKQPINIYIDSGYLNINTHLNKRFIKAYVMFHNINCVEVPMSLDFTIDGRQRQTSKTARMRVIDGQVINYTDTDYKDTYVMEPFKTESESVGENVIGFDKWLLGLSKFGPLNKLRLEHGISGRGRVPQFAISFEVTGDFEFEGFGVQYKEQSVR